MWPKALLTLIAAVSLAVGRGRPLPSIVSSLSTARGNAGGRVAPPQQGPRADWTFQGRVYEGNVGDEPPLSQPFPGVIVTVYGSYSPYPSSGFYIRETATDGTGWYGLTVYDDDGPYEFYHVRETVPPGYHVVGATSVSGTVRTGDWIEYVVPLETKTLTGNKFWIQADPTGWLEGRVMDAELGEATPPCTGAMVHVEPGGLNLPADPGTGNYGPLELAAGSYAVGASAPGFSEEGPFDLEIVAGVTTTQDFHLSRPVVQVTPAELTLTTAISESVSRPLTIENTGHLPLDFEILESLPPADLPWLWEDPISGNVPGLDDFQIEVTFHCTETGEYVGTLHVIHNAPCEDTVAVPIRLQCPEPWAIEWGKWINGEPWFPDIVVTTETSDTIQVVDVLTGAQHLSLTEHWDIEYLDLLDHQVDPLVGTVTPGDGSLEWQVPLVEPTTVTMTKWFHVEPCHWESTSLVEELWVGEERAASRRVSVEKLQPDLWIASANDPEVFPGQEARFLLRYGNLGGYERDVRVWGEFPPQAPLASAIPPPDATSPEGSWAEWRVGDLAMAGQGSIEVGVTVTQSAVPSTTIAIGAWILDHTGQAADITSTIFHVSGACPPPVASFLWDPTTACPGRTLYFWDTSVSLPTGWLWNFDGQGSSTLQHPTFTFSTIGPALVQLTVSNTCGIDVATETLQVVGCPSQPDGIDIYIKDNVNDDGSVPSDPPWWTSPDIWVRHADDGDTRHQNPLPGTVNYVYLRVRNRMAATVHDITVNLYFASPALSLQWPQSWSPIGSVFIPSLAPGAEAVLSVPWSTPDIVGHFCLLARADSPDDPVAIGPDTVAPADRAEHDNNVGLRNVNIVSYPEIDRCGDYTTTVDTDVVYVDAVNTADATASVDIVFDSDEFPLESGTITVEPGSLWGRWSSLAAFNQMGTTLIPTAFPATMVDIAMAPFETARITVTVTAEIDERFTLRLEEWTDGMPVGGVEYARVGPLCVHMPVLLK
jgi:PKD repeat protein